VEESVIKQLTTILERMARVEAKLDLALTTADASRKAIGELGERLVKAEAAAKAAHKRIDHTDQQRAEDRETTRWAIGIGVAAAGVLSSIIALFLGR
jgi:hypothetical protein